MTARRRLAAASVALALLAAGVTVAHAAPPPATRTRHTYRGPAGERDYLLTVPRARDPRRLRPLVVFLHGCTQTAEQGAVSTRFDEAAVRYDVVVAYPEQDPDANGSRCWNWFLPGHQHRESGEPAILAGLTREVIARRSIDPRRVYVVGISAGADMTTNLGAAYPDLYSALGVFAGCAYRTCTDLDGSAAYAEMGPRARPVPVMVVQGSADMANNAVMGETALRQWLRTNDLADNGDADGSVSDRPTHELFYGPRPPGTPADLCLSADRTGLPCLGGALGWTDRYPYTVRRYDDDRGRTLVEYWLIHGLNHAYPGGDTNGTFVDPLGPDVTNGTMRFLLQHAR